MSKPSQILIPDSYRKLRSPYLADPLAPAAVVYALADSFCGEAKHDIDAWEPETIWLELSRIGLAPVQVNRDKILCCSSLRRNGLFFTSANVFKNVALTFNNISPLADVGEEAEAEQLSWAIVGIRAFLGDAVPFYFDYEPVAYTAKILHDEGFFVAPRALRFVQEHLSRLNKNCEIEAEVRQALEHPDSPQNEIVATQVAKHDRVQKYTQAMFDEFQAAMADLRENGIEVSKI